jgi:hypothetical protein
MKKIEEIRKEIANIILEPYETSAIKATKILNINGAIYINPKYLRKRGDAK